MVDEYLDEKDLVRCSVQVGDNDFFLERSVKQK
jgi:hypothetical protein